MTTPGVLGQFDVEEEIARFPPDGPRGRRAETLLKIPSLRVVLVTMRAGTELHEHVAPGPITVQPLQGRFTLVVDGEEQEIAPGMLVALAERARHAVRAVEDGAFLLTIGWPPQEQETGP
jgi:quercetin dioxygenase-like cupin family protein